MYHLDCQCTGVPPPPQIHPDVFLLWDGLHKLSAILALDVQGTAQARGDWTLVNTPALAASYARLTADLRAVGSQSSLEVTPLNNEQELQRRITRWGGGRGGEEEGEGRRKGMGGGRGGEEEWEGRRNGRGGGRGWEEEWEGRRNGRGEEGRRKGRGGE